MSQALEEFALNSRAKPGTRHHRNLGVNLRQIGEESDPDGFYANAGCFQSDGYAS